MALIDPMQLSALERADLAIAARMLPADGSDEWIAAVQRALDGLRQPGAADVAFLASLLRLRGFAVTDEDAAAAGHPAAGGGAAGGQPPRRGRGVNDAEAA
ncbi:MAG: hypothetical protein ACK595_21975, partial [Planctomycetota bacterium]